MVNIKNLSLAVWSAILLRTVTSKCYDSIVDINKLESLVKDLSVQRTYVLCENTRFQIDSFQSYYGPTPNAAYTILHLRPNMHVKCGNSGSHENNCTFVGGDVQIEGTQSFGVAHSRRLEGVVLQGLTFVQPRRHMVLLDQPGDVLFLSCLFTEATNALLPVKLDFFDPSSNDVLHARFRGCSFKNIHFKDYPSQPAIIVGYGPQNRITITDSTFENNAYTKSQNIGSLIETQGPIDLFRNCFLNNTVGQSLVTVYQSTLAAHDNYEDVPTRDRTCGFTAFFPTSAAYELLAPLCNKHDSAKCVRIDPTTPTEKPTSTPTKSPTLSPIGAPSSQPSTMAPTDSPTLSTLWPTMEPTSTPTSPKTGTPSLSHTFVPTRTAIASQEEPTSFNSVNSQSRAAGKTGWQLIWIFSLLAAL